MQSEGIDIKISALDNIDNVLKVHVKYHCEVLRHYKNKYNDVKHET